MKLDDDWFPGAIPDNVLLGRETYLDTAYGFTLCASDQFPAVVLGDACGAYDRATFVVGPEGRIRVGDFTCLNGTYLICRDRITIGANCLLAWGVVLTDSWVGLTGGGAISVARRRAVLRAAARHPLRHLDPVAPPEPVTLADNVWVGFDSVVLPGVTLGHGCVVGCKTVVRTDVPPYAVVAGDPARILRFLDPDDTLEIRARALAEHTR